MNWTKLFNRLKIIMINVIFIIVPLVMADAWFLSDKLDNRTVNITCRAQLTNYDYCADITHLRYMSLADRWFPVVNHIDAQRRSTYSKPPTFKSNGKRVFLIGDSFIQAEELFIEERFEHMLREQGYEVHAYGYSSWNSNQFHSIVKSLKLGPDDTVMVFSMGNDYTPNYRLSTIKTAVGADKDALAIVESRTLGERVIANSMIINTYNRAVKAYAGGKKAGSPPEQEHKSKLITRSHDAQNWRDCTSLPAIEALASPLIHDYVALSKHHNCWPQSIRESVDINVKLLKEAADIAQKQGSNFSIALIPGGWAYPDQNTLGRMAPMYSVPEGVVITQTGLADKLATEGLKVLDLEGLLDQHIQKGRDSLYFPADGHYTAVAHKIIGSFLVKELAGIPSE
jgi:hypothetical protein